MGIQYITAWLSGKGAVAIFNLMEDAATAEIARSQIWQWCRHTKAELEDGRKITIELVKSIILEEIDKIKESSAAKYKLENLTEANELFLFLVSSKKFEEFLTTRAYEKLD